MNVIKHARAENVDVILTNMGRTVEIEIRDDGITSAKKSCRDKLSHGKRPDDDRGRSKVLESCF